MPYRPTSLSAKQLADAARAGRENALHEREIAEIDRDEAAQINGGLIATTDPFTTTGYYPPEPISI